VWWPVTDPDAGDAVARYQLQADSNPAFTAPVIDETNILALAWPPGSYWIIGLPLDSFSGSSNLVAGTTYYWRVRAQDLHGLSSDWSAGQHTFQFGTAAPEPEPAAITGLRRGTNGTLVLQWTAVPCPIFVEHSPRLNPSDWQTVAGPVTGTNWTFTPAPGATSGFYRLRSE
jgi:hypothetical protein